MLRVKWKWNITGILVLIVTSIIEKKNTISRIDFGHIILSTNFNRIWFYHSREFRCVRKFIINWNIMFVPVRKLIKFSLTHYIGLMWIMLLPFIHILSTKTEFFRGCRYSITPFNSCMIYLNGSYFKRSFIIIL